MRKYHVIYLKGNKEATFVVTAENKKEAFKKFKKACSNCYTVSDVIDNTARVQAKSRALLITVAIAMLVVLFALVIQRTWMDPKPVDYLEYTVEEGDTLWSVARKSNMWNKMDGHDIIDDIMSKSNCSYTIYPGQTIYIPIYGD